MEFTMPRIAHLVSRPSWLTALAAASLFSLSACDRNTADPPMPRAENFPVAPSTPGDTSVPPASAVITPAEPAPATSKDNPPATQSNAPMTKKQESAEMPLGGQANDRSAPKAAEAAKVASAPKR
ncbi:MAG: hypothetical protein AD742_03170 [Methylibium sp. NZG]|nr:MAG: hypothetical protein AD742_03170 [Methylibium sp. NZG]